MRPVSDDFLAAIATSHTPAFSVTVEGVDLPVESGSVTLDRTAATRASLSLDLAPDDLDLWVPDSPADLLAPYGNEITVARGVDYGNGARELIDLGVFRVDETTVSDDGGSLNLTVSGLDRSAAIIDAVFESGGIVAKGADAAETIQSLIWGSGADVTYSANFLDIDVALPLLSYEAGDDRWDFCRGLAEAIGGSILYFDGAGILTLKRFAERGTPDYTVTEGLNLISASKQWGREDACNRVVVTGETSGEAPVIGVATDDVAGSPTNYYSSDFGRVTFGYSSEYVTGADQAKDVAEAILAERLGTGQQISFDSLVAPHLEPGDTIEVVRERIGVSELHVIDSLTIPLTPAEAMSCTTRVTRVVS